MRVLAGRYELVELVGRGGMGEVWKGVDRELGRTVAVKVLPVELTRQEEFRHRFRREARTGAALSHHGVATLHDVGEDVDGTDVVPFLVMEFIDGRTLTEVLRAGPMPIARAIAIARDVADALVHSHGVGLVHRDIKPSNVMVTASGAVKVLDFGIAKALAETTTRLTATGRMVGTPAYLAPEQIDGDAVDARADIYSLGCLLYELLTGRPPFSGDSPFAVMNQHLTKTPPPPSALRTDIPEQVDAVTLVALAKAPDRRYGDAAAFRSALESTQRELNAAAVVPPHARTTVVGRPRSGRTGRRTPDRDPASGSIATPVAPARGTSGRPEFASQPGESIVPSQSGHATGADGTQGRPSPTTRLRRTEGVSIAVLGWVLLVAYAIKITEFEDPHPVLPLAIVSGVAAIGSLSVLLWSVRLSITISWPFVFALSCTMDLYGAGHAFRAVPCLVLVPFAGVAFFRRRPDSVLPICLLWMGLAIAWWAFTSEEAPAVRESGYTMAVLLVVAVTTAQELAERRSAIR
ncbi:protein kinase [Embleya sp. NPDC008237]|uniref:protein kinase domain-containing protein n=1 Tax=Embleya sp. NPDC008237 TaxID=3363978 RepID=UPI0036E6644E